MALPSFAALRYVLPLREGGSLPAIIDTDEPGQFVVKFRGAGQGPRALVAEVIGWGIARALGLPVPDAAIVDLADGFGAAEPNPEIQDLLRGSTGKNFALRYLSGALGFDPAADRDRIAPDLAAAIVWFDALITNVDRTARNPNILLWKEAPWLIDHGAALYFHHAATDWLARASDRFPLIRDHILLKQASAIQEAGARLCPRLTDAVLRDILAAVPDEWLEEGAEVRRTAYVSYLSARLQESGWQEEAEAGRSKASSEVRRSEV